MGGAVAAAIVDRTGRHRLPIGSEDFEKVVSRRVYVDKTLLIRDLLDSSLDVTLLCRPRRFGKSLAMRMLQCFFESPVEGYVPDRSRLFDGLAIARAKESYLSERACHPVVFLSLGGVGGPTREGCWSTFARQVSAEYVRHRYVLEGAALAEVERESFERVMGQRASEAELLASLASLSDCLARHHGTDVVILIDEYDHMVTEGHLNGYRDFAIDVMRRWLTGALKATTSLFLACLTGVQRVSCESVFSGLNNVVVDTAMDLGFIEGFGFTRAEAEALARYQGLAEDKLPEMHDWYNGYNFGGVEAYNPWSVLNYLRQGGVAQPYWGNTSDNAIVHQLFQKATGESIAELQDLAAGGVVVRPLDLATVFSELDQHKGLRSDAALWGQLYLAGYVTTDDVAMPHDDMVPRRLRRPNREVGWLYRREFAERTIVAVGNYDLLLSLKDALVSGDATGLACALEHILVDSPSYLDLVSENSYHMLLLGLVYDIAGYRFPQSNRESGDGRPDIALEPELENQGLLPAIVIEVKDAHDGPAGLDALSQAALRQAEERRYGIDLAGAGRLCWGIAFSGKRASCASRRLG